MIVVTEITEDSYCHSQGRGGIGRGEANQNVYGNGVILIIKK